MIDSQLLHFERNHHNRLWNSGGSRPGVWGGS